MSTPKIFDGARDAWLLQSDEQLLRDCRVDSYRGSGPGGQHRNTSDTAVRLTHQPSGAISTASERRSRKQNHAAAVQRLRHQIAVCVRCSPAIAPEKPNWQLSLANPAYPLLIAHVLDAVQEAEGAVGDTARAIGLSTGKLIRLLHRDSAVWQAVNRVRAEHELHPLKAPHR
ncbi:MAG TPA: hypothetical protein DCR55_01555 [Lentisphaeria bacterium]|jgi:hypothetical protein|nr:hypothetical protein [Lentisphaeria bacterium]